MSTVIACRRFRRHLGVLGLAAGSLCSGVASAQSTVPRILVLGDSWAHFAAPELDEVLEFFGHGNKEAVVSLAGGGLAAVLATPGELDLVAAELAAHPTVDVVHLSIGGNDLLGNWNTGLSPAAQAALFDQIAADAHAIVQHVLALHPKLRVTVVGYDWLNFVETVAADPLGICGLQWLLMGTPTPLQLNTAVAELEARKAALAAADPRIDYVDVQGFMQVFFGYPGLGLPPRWPTLPDVSLPSPPEALAVDGDDCIHLSEQGYEIVCTHAWNVSYAPYFEPPTAVLRPPAPGVAGATSLFVLDGLPPGELFAIVVGTQPANIPWPGCPGLALGMADPILLAVLAADQVGCAVWPVFVPASAAGVPLLFQGLAPFACAGTDAIAWTFLR